MRLIGAAVVLLLIAWPFLAANAHCQQRPEAVLVLEHEKPSAWNETLRDAFRQGCGEYGFDCREELALPGPDLNARFSEIAGKADLLLVASDNLHEALRDNAAKFRRVKFGSIDAGIRAANIMSVTFADQEASFLAGNAAAMLAAALYGKDATLGWLSGEDSPAMRSLYNGFAEGAKLADPQIRIVQALAKSPDDVEGAMGKADWLLEQGAKVLVLAAGAANPLLAEKLDSEKVWFIPLDDRLKKPMALGWLWRRPDRAIQDLLAAAASKFRAREIDVHGLADGYVDFELAPDLRGVDATLAANIRRRVAELRRELVSGGIKVPSLRARTLCDCLD